MLKGLRLRNFRAFQEHSFDFSRLNIFVGANSTGKSSAISAINFIAQSILQNDVSSGPLSLNNQYEQLGTFQDVIYGKLESSYVLTAGVVVYIQLNLN